MEQNPTGGGQAPQRQPPRPNYDPNNGGHYGASALVRGHDVSPSPALSSALNGISDCDYSSRRKVMHLAQIYIKGHGPILENDTHDYKLHHLPLARIKKVMKADPEVKMISAEAPILFAKGCDIFITELTMRAWIHAEENKRRTLQRSDIASALAKSDMFDFLIDIVPREEAASHAKRSGGQGGSSAAAAQSVSASGGPLPPPHGNVQQQPHSHQQAPQQHPMAPPEYPLAHNPMAPEQEYRQQTMYAPQVPPDPTHPYGQPQQQMFGDMYGYPTLPPQQMYPVNQRGPDPSGGQDPGHHYQRHDGGEGDADAEGERDYEVG